MPLCFVSSPLVQRRRQNLTNVAKIESRSKVTLILPRRSVYMNFSSNILKAESKTSSLLVSFAEAQAYICAQHKYNAFMSLCPPMSHDFLRPANATEEFSGKICMNLKWIYPTASEFLLSLRRSGVCTAAALG